MTGVSTLSTAGWAEPMVGRSTPRVASLPGPWPPAPNVAERQLGFSKRCRLLVAAPLWRSSPFASVGCRTRSHALLASAPQTWRRYCCRARGTLSAASALAEVEVSAAATDREERVAEQAQGAQGDDQFVWEANWYPVSVIKDLDKRIPEAVTILGRPMVLWWDRNAAEGRGQWRVFADLCPHRLAPLSEGRIHESGDLQCSYHGWTFDGQGACTMIPQAPKEGPPVAASPRACARPYPSREHQGLLWVWPQLGPDGEVAAAAADPPSFPPLSDPTFSTVSIGQSNLCYSQEMLVENLVDPAHADFAHHNVYGQGRRPQDRKPWDLAVKAITRGGFSAEGAQIHEYNFQAPCLVTFTVFVDHQKKEGENPSQPTSSSTGAPAGGAGESPAGGPGSALEALPDGDAKGRPGAGREVRIALYCIPTLPGFSRLIFVVSYNFLPRVVTLMPTWFTHLGRILVLDSDHLLLHQAERRLEAAGGKEQALKSYFNPTGADALVGAYRQWLSTKAGGGVRYPDYVDPTLPPELPKRVLMDRQQSHVKICKSCRQAQMWFERVQLGLQIAAYAIIALLAVKVALPGKVSAFGAALAFGISALCAGVSRYLSHFISKQYHFHDYVHALVP